MSGTIERSAFRYDGRQDKRETKGVEPHFREDVENGVVKIKGRVRESERTRNESQRRWNENDQS